MWWNKALKKYICHVVLMGTVIADMLSEQIIAKRTEGVDG